MALQANALTTVDVVKAKLGITYNDDNAVIEDLINECSDWIESKINRQLKDSAPVTEYYNGASNGKVLMRKYPVNSITSVAYASGTLDAPTWNVLPASSSYVLDEYSGILNVEPMYTGSSNYRIIYRGGFTTVPSDLVLACKKMVAKEYLRRNSEGAKGEQIGDASASWDEDIDPSVTKILNRYKRYVF